MNMKRFGLVYIITTVINTVAFGQDISIKLGPNEIASNQYFTITVEVKNDRVRDYDQFPEIKGFEKSGVSTSSYTNIVNGQMTFSQSIIQNYIPTGEGVFTLSPFSVTVNGKSIKSNGTKIKVGPPIKQKQYDPFAYDPFEDFFGDRKNTEYIEVHDDAFLALTIDKNEVYVGEGFTATLAFYIPEDTRARLAFYETGKQVSEIINKIRPKNCWEENFNIDKIERERVSINNKMHLRYRIFESRFYPLNDEPVEFPSVNLKMIKYKEAKNPSFMSMNRKEDFKTYSTKAKTVKVKPLPPHPLKDNVSVGRYTLKENISAQELKTGESFNYNFTILGEGNISAITEPRVSPSDDFDFYDPNIQQRIRRSNDIVKGSKSFDYYVIPNEPGDFKLADYLQWIYFDPQLEKYDTLKSEYTFHITGESKKNEFISATDLGSFYDLIELEDNTVKGTNWDLIFKILSNVLLGIMLVVTLIIIFRKR